MFVFIPGIVALEFLTVLNRLDLRLLSPAYVPTMILIAWCGERLLLPNVRSQLWRTAVAALLIGWIALLAGVSANFARGSAQGERAKGEKDHVSALTTAARALPAGATLFSNSPSRLWLGSGIGSKSTPNEVGYRTSTATGESTPEFSAETAANAACAPVFVIWYEDPRSDIQFVPLDDLSAAVGLLPQYQDSDGSISAATSSPVAGSCGEGP